jgi:uncharacterized protein
VLISLKELERQAVEFQTQFKPGALDFRGAEIKQFTPLALIGTARLSGGEIRISGHLESAVQKACDRCLEPVEIPLKRDFDLSYRPLGTIARQEEVEIKNGDSDVAFYSGDGLLLTDVAAEQVILSVPMKAICRPDCKGLCATCGVNRNVKPCGCPVPQVESPFAVLKKL